MGHMVRKQVYIKPEHERLLKHRARELGVSEAELIRQGIDRLSNVSVGLPLDEAAWEEELAFTRERAQIPSLERPRNWTRDELYEE
jgi:hypothetical protein